MVDEYDREPTSSEQDRATVLDDSFLYMSEDEQRKSIREYRRARGLPERVLAEGVLPVDESRSA